MYAVMFLSSLLWIYAARGGGDKKLEIFSVGKKLVKKS